MRLPHEIAAAGLKSRPVAVVDIGSNSVRLVVYDGLKRAPAPLFNEKILCGLGRGVALTGRLSDSGTGRALAALRRFRALCRQMDAAEVFAVATAAVREASNGKEFIALAEEALSHKIRVLSGKREARVSALGVIFAIPEADGLVGDLGGGSLELVDIRKGEVRDGVTLPLGPLRLIDMSAGSIGRATGIVDEILAATRLVEKVKGRTFYLVGGTWRNLMRLHMEQTHYPLHVLHQFTVAPDAARSVASLVAGLSVASLKDIPAVSRSRSETLPFGALVLERILACTSPKQVTVSIYGLREGLLHSRLKKRQRDADPLLSACWELARRYSRSPEHELELCEWTDQLFQERGLKESADQRRLRHAACMLADISWRAHPDYRGGRSLMMISQAAFVGVDHPGRLFLALCVFYRYEGAQSEDAPREFLRLVNDDAIERARVIAAAVRLAYVLSAAMPGLLPRIGLNFASEKLLTLSLKGDLADLVGEPVKRRLEQLAELLGRSARIDTA